MILFIVLSTQPYSIRKAFVLKLQVSPFALLKHYRTASKENRPHQTFFSSYSYWKIDEFSVDWRNTVTLSYKTNKYLKKCPSSQDKNRKKRYFLSFLLIIWGHFPGSRSSLQKETLIRELEGPECGRSVLLGISSYVFLERNFTLSDKWAWQKWIKDVTSPILYLVKKKVPILKPTGNICHLYKHCILPPSGLHDLFAEGPLHLDLYTFHSNS